MTLQRTLLVNKLSALDRCADPSRPLYDLGKRSSSITYWRLRCSEPVWWAREELNLRPLPCQIQRAATGLYVGRLETGKDHEEAAGERRCLRPGRSDNPS